MALSNPRYKILPLRGTLTALTAEVANITEGEICYATDKDQYYQKEGGVLVAVGATKAQGALADTAVQPGDNISALTNDAGYITLAEVPGDLVTSVAGKTGDVTLAKADVGLGNVDNTSDANKPISTSTQAALDLKADLVGGFIPTSQIPAIAITEFLGSVASDAAMQALSGQQGDWCLRTDKAVGYVIIGPDPTQLSSWEAFTVPGSAVTSINTQVGDVVLGAVDVGAATAAQGTLADSAVQPGDNVSTLTNDAGYITAAQVPGDAVTSVNTQTGAVVLDADDIDDTSTAHKFTSAADISKLAGIASGAEVNVQSDWNATSGDALILNKPIIPTNNNQLINGAGYITSADGGNAATLDGIDSSQFLRSDAADTWSGDISTTGTNGIRFGSPNQIDGNDGYIAAGRFASGLNIVGTQTTAGTGRQVRIWGDVITSTGDVFWNAGNDGSGSGLDADTLDGAQPSVSPSSSTIVQRHSSGYIYANYFNTTPNDVTTGVTKVCVETNNDGFIRHGDAGSIRAFINVENGATADQTASEILTAIKTVDGSGSGLDADTLDGVQGSSYLRSDADDTTTGNLTFAKGASGTLASRTGYSDFLGYSTSYGSYIGGGTGNAAAALYAGGFFYDGSTTHTLWHAGNDGAFSGLDADKLDGQQGSYYLDYNNLTNKPSSPSSADIQEFTTSGTWTKPSGAKLVRVIAVGGGGGGGGGALMLLYGDLGAGGGGGGAGGVRFENWFEASDLGATETVTIGSGGSGGAGASTMNSNGFNGSDGGASSFGSHLVALGGDGGSRGEFYNITSNTPIPGAAGGVREEFPRNTSETYLNAGGANGASPTSSASNPYDSLYGPGGGGGGWGVRRFGSNTNLRSGSGGGVGMATNQTASAWNSDFSSSRTPVSTAGATWFGGGGGGSGGDAGGAGGANGGGGGGGAARTTSGSSPGGTGGTGGDGVVIVYTYF